MTDPTPTPLTDAERDALWTVWESDVTDDAELAGLFFAAVAVIASARSAAASADERKRITAAIRWLIHADAADDEYVKVGYLRAALAQPADTQAPAHELIASSWCCRCGWRAPLGKSFAREFDRHLLEVRSRTST